MASLTKWVTEEKSAMSVMQALSTDLPSWRADEFLKRVMADATKMFSSFEKKKGAAPSNRERTLMFADAFTTHGAACFPLGS